MQDIGYCIGVDVCPDRTEEMETAYKLAQIAQGNAVKCEKCGEFIYRGERGFETKLCSRCAAEYVRKTKKLLNYLKESTNGEATRLINMLLSFLCDTTEIDSNSAIAPAELFAKYLQED